MPSRPPPIAPPLPVLKCPLCGGIDFEKQRGKLDSRWGWTAHRVDMRICQKCGYLMQFYKGRTFFGDFD